MPVALINHRDYETRVAVVEAGRLLNIVHISDQTPSYLEDIYLGKVARVMPGMQAAFIDIGLQKNGFLPRDQLRKTNQPQAIERCLYEGQTLLVQVKKDPVADKGALLTTAISLATDNLAYLPLDSGVGASKKITDAEKRAQLTDSLRQWQESRNVSGAWVARTAAQHVSIAQLEKEFDGLSKQWQRVASKSKQESAPALVHSDNSRLSRVTKALVGYSLETIWVDDAAMLAQLESMSVDGIQGLAFYDKKQPLFDAFEIENQLDAALERKVTLPSGGYLVIDENEAMTTVDVNTGAFTGKKGEAQTHWQTNQEACNELVRQMSIRNLSGIIVVDFIDMVEQRHRSDLMQQLANELKSDSEPCQVSELSSLGLVQITRKRSSASLRQQLMQACSCCQGDGVVATKQTQCRALFRQIERLVYQAPARHFKVSAKSGMIDFLTEDWAKHLASLELTLAISLNLDVDDGVASGCFKVVSV